LTFTVCSHRFESVKPEPSIFDQRDAEADERALLEAGADADADADADAGRVVSHEEVGRWLLKIGTPDEGPMPESWLK
jgi:predicted transcriptional regulator